MRKKALLFGIVIITSIIVISLSIFALNPGLKSRDRYKPYDFNSDPGLVSFAQAYEEARLDPTSWAANPLTLTLRLAGYPDPDGNDPDRIDTYDTPTGLTVVIERFDLRDDSLEAEEVRVDLVRKGAVWEIAWAGRRWRCRRALFSGWTTALCP